jgi:alginate O-acetyltransferase complex protein AlgI
MLFPTYQFLIFFIIIFSLGISLKKDVVRYKIFLLIVSLVFYGFWSWQFLGLLILCTIINYLFLIPLPQKKSKFVLIVALIFNIGYLGIFKYYNFFINSLLENLTTLKIPENLTSLQIFAPLGVSFYIFRIISHLIDSYQQKIPHPSFINYTTYITYFPQIASGPITRAPEFYQQLNTPNRYDYKIEQVIVLILSGLFKKYTLSSFLFNFTQLPFKLPHNYSSFDLTLSAIAYSCLIYVDFSGYSDLANAISSLLGFAPIQNFNMPYRSRSLQEFWQRWHISLSEWLRDYLYIPLGGNRKGKLRQYINLMLTMLIGGFWHGAGLNFIVWGGLHGIGLIINHTWKKLAQNWEIPSDTFGDRLLNFLSWFLTFTFITGTWIFFNTSSWENALNFCQGIFTSDIKRVTFNMWQLYAVFIIVASMNLYGNQISQSLMIVLSLKNVFFRVAIVSCFVYGILMLGPSTVPPFIYFGF